MLTVELTVDDITGTLLDAIDDVSGVRSIAVDDTTLIIHFDDSDTTPIRRAVESGGGTIVSFSQRSTRTFDPSEDRADEPFDIGSTMGGT